MTSESPHSHDFTAEQRVAIEAYSTSLRVHLLHVPREIEVRLQYPRQIASRLHDLLRENLCYMEHTLKNDLDFPVIRFLCYASLQDNDEFVPATLITPKIAAMEYMVKSVCLNTIQVAQKKHIGVTFEQTINSHQKYVRDGVQTPFNQLRETTRLCCSYVHAQGSVPRVTWLDDSGTKLAIDGIKVTLDDLRMLVKTGLKETRAKMETDVFLSCPLPSSRDISVGVTDNPRFKTAGHYFRDDSEELKKLSPAILDHIYSDPRLRSRFIERETPDGITFSMSWNG
jgi:hypothetical protein